MQQERRVGDQINFGRRHDGQCDHIQDCDEAERHLIATADRVDRRKTAGQSGRGQHGLHTALLL
jgi:hypothetical protein